jgi:hypothetical protein
MIYAENHYFVVSITEALVSNFRVVETGKFGAFLKSVCE